MRGTRLLRQAAEAVIKKENIGQLNIAYKQAYAVAVLWKVEDSLKADENLVAAYCDRLEAYKKLSLAELRNEFIGDSLSDKAFALLKDLTDEELDVLRMVDINVLQETYNALEEG